jgi:hypothetical protein
MGDVLEPLDLVGQAHPPVCVLIPAVVGRRGTYIGLPSSDLLISFLSFFSVPRSSNGPVLAAFSPANHVPARRDHPFLPTLKHMFSKHYFCTPRPSLRHSSFPTHFDL